MSMPTVSESQPAITLDGISVLYRVPRERVSGFKEFAIRWLQRRVHYEQFLALREVTFSVGRGESFGVIGRNGSGKSTLLKVVSRVLHPTQGRIVTCGRVAPLLELGGGFHPELTGRENVYLNAALLGYPRQQTEDLFAEIVDFAEIGDFIDAPIRTYSTGMVARLGFAVATCTRPEILLLDEVLSVGDGRFQQKCLDRMFSFRDQGTTILFVSHSMATVEAFCQRAAWLDGGRLAALGKAEDVVREYVKAERGQSAPAASPEPIEAAESPGITLPRPVPAPVSLPLAASGAVYPAQGLLDVAHGSISAWLKFDSSQPHRDAMILHSDDSRFVLYVGAYYSPEFQRDIWLVIARAGGNRRAFDTYFGTASFPEATLEVCPDESGTAGRLTPDAWHLVTVTWDGYLEGTLRLYLDDWLAVEKRYSRQNDDGRELLRFVAVGMRPLDWMGEVVHEEGSTPKDLRPESTLPLAGSGWDARDLRVYPAALDRDQVETIFKAGTSTL